MGELNSAIYEGHVHHFRVGPPEHHVHMPLYMLYLDLNELAQLDAVRGFGVERRALASFRRSDYLGSRQQSLSTAVQQEVYAQSGRSPRGAVRMLTQVRTFGYVFNPVTFYYCFDEERPACDSSPSVVLVQITNTPWNERHSYVVPQEGAQQCAAEFDKAFHVSPFMPMDQRYRFVLSAPAHRLAVSVENFEGPRRVFQATLSLTRRPFAGRELARVLTRHPGMALRGHAAIYAHAFSLWRKRATFYPHPERRQAAGGVGNATVRT